MARNAELLRAVGDLIAAHPHLYDQSEWAMAADCGTYGCVAGHAVDLAEGYTLDHNRDRGAVSYRPDGTRTTTSVAARDALGLTEDEAHNLFAGSWRPAGWDAQPPAVVAGLVRQALYRLADGASVLAVTAPDS